MTRGELMQMGMADVYIYCAKQAAELARLRAENARMRIAINDLLMLSRKCDWLNAEVVHKLAVFANGD